MNTNNEKWHGSPKKGGNSYDSREGRQFEKGGNNSPFSKPGRNQKVYSSRNTSNSNYDNRSTGGKPYYKNENKKPYRRPFTSDENTEGENRKLKLVKPGKFVETRFDDRQPNVTFRKRKNKTEGEFNPNDKYSLKKQLEYQKNNVDYSKPIRLNKFLANAGICSRREADEFIQSGVISVNGEVVTQLGAKIMMTDTVMFKNQPVQSERKVYLLLNKPKDCLTTSDDPNNRKTVLDLVKNACSERIYPVGRLDRNTTGVLLLTNDGDLAAKLTHPKYNKKKIYHAVLDKNLETVDYESIIQGVDLGDEHVSVDALEFVKAGNRREIGIEIHSGQNRVVRRIFEKFGYKVVYLDRVYFAGLTKKNVPRGKYRFLTQREINMLKMGAYE
ncbi:MAG TPA: pseudouridine synthase [Paludibacteraceae bacterium]|nr:pseudouridine synthase [Paludibacteraceae bacterium]